MKRISIFVFGSLLICTAMILPPFGAFRPCQAQDDNSEFTRVRRIYIEGAKFLQEKRYSDAVPMLAQAYKLLTRSVEQGSKDKRTLRALRKLRYFLGYSYYQVGRTKAQSSDDADKKFTRQNYKKAVPLLKRYLKESQTAKRRKESTRILALMQTWLKLNPPPPPKRIAPPVAIKPQKGPLRAWPFVILGIGVAAAIAGGVTAGLALSNAGERDKLFQTLSESTNPPSKEVAQFHRQAELLATTSYVLWGAGGAVAVVGIILIATVGRAPPPNPPALSPVGPRRSHMFLSTWGGLPE